MRAFAVLGAALAPRWAVGSLPVAEDLASYVASLELVVDDFYDNKVNGVEFEVDRMTCTELGFESLSWANDGPRLYACESS